MFNLMIIFLPILAFIIAGIFVGLVFIMKVCMISSSPLVRKEVLLGSSMTLLAPLVFIFLFVYFELSKGEEIVSRLIINSGEILVSYIFIATPIFLVVAIIAKLNKHDGTVLLFWGSLFSAVSIPILLILIGNPIYEFLGNTISSGVVDVREMKTY